MDFDITNYGAFAKMLAREDINLQVDPSAETACFDVKGRVLTLPKWEGMDKATLRMLIGHEVGHAIHTPSKGWRKAIEAKENDLDKQIFQSYLNIIEDCRIDKLMQLKWPGLRPDYTHAAKFLMQKDFFKLGDKDINELSFIDKINVRYKTKWTSSGLKPSMTSEEKAYIPRIDSLETWQEVVDLSEELFEKYKEDPQSSYSSIKSKYDQMSEEAQKKYLEGGGEEDGAGSSNLNGRFNFDENDEEENSKQNQNGKRTQVSSPTIADAAHPGQTVTAFNESIKSRGGANIAISRRSTGSVAHVHPVKVSNFYLDTWQNDIERREPLNVPEINSKNKPTVNRFASFFESLKRGREYSKVRESKTGSIDMLRLHQYRYNEEIFSVNETLNHQKNHGFIFLVDCSGSMDDVFESVVKQLFIFTSICERLGVPFIACGFSDCFSAEGDIKNYSNKKNITLQKFFDSREPRKVNYERMSKLNSIRLGGTPLSDSLYLSRSLIEDFQNRHSVDVLNFVLVTDGGDGTYANHQYIQDTKTKIMVKNEKSPRGTEDNVAGTLKLLKKLFGIRVMYFDITENVSYIDSVVGNEKSSFNKDGYLIKKNMGGADNVVFIKESLIGNSDGKFLRILADSLA